MWKYTHTDEMYHSLINGNNSDVLYHSDVYLGEIYEDGLKHFKYIKREMVNGRWKYYYKDEAYDKAEKAYNEASSKHYNTQQKLSKLDDKRNKNTINTIKNTHVVNKYKESSGINKVANYIPAKVAERNIKKLQKEAKEQTKEQKKLEKDLDKHDKEMNKTYTAKIKAANKNKIQKKAAAVTVGVANAISDGAHEAKKEIKKAKVKRKIKKNINKGKRAVEKAIYEYKYNN